MNHIPADKPTMYFIGVTTSQSSIINVFPEWSRFLELGNVELKGIDLKVHDSKENYQEVLQFIKEDPLSRGALVTTHKVDIFQAGKYYFDLLGHDAHDLGEISSIYKLENKLIGEARDSITSGFALKRFIPEGYWKQTGGRIFIIGAGGSAIALSTFLMRSARPDNRPDRIIVSNRSETRLEEMKKIHQHIAQETETPVLRDYRLAEKPEDNDAIIAELPPGSLVINATGLGKDRPGSPLTGNAQFPENGLIWEFNYRGDLLFLNQAEAQKESNNLTIIDGWDYFLYGWTRVIADVFHIDIPVTGPNFETISSLAASVRNS